MSELLSAPAPSKFDTAELITSLASSHEYRRNQAEGYSMTRALARTALEHTGMQHRKEREDTYTPNLRKASLEKARKALVGTLPDYIYGIEGMRYAHTGGHLSDEAYHAMKARATRFNHSVKAVIERDPTLDFDDVSSMVTTLYGVMNRDRWGRDRHGYEREASWFRGQFEGTLRGMQQEVIAHQVMDAINRLGPRRDNEAPRVVINADVSAEDDMHGADMYVTLDGVTFPVDIKASEHTVEKIQKKHKYAKDVMTSGIHRRELGGAFRISDERALEEAPRMLAKLYAAREGFITRNQLDLAA